MFFYLCLTVFSHKKYLENLGLKRKYQIDRFSIFLNYLPQIRFKKSKIISKFYRISLIWFLIQYEEAFYYVKRNSKILKVTCLNTNFKFKETSI